MAPAFRATGRSRDFGVVPDLHGLEAHATFTTEFRNPGAEKFILLRPPPFLSNWTMAQGDVWPRSIFARNLADEAGITELMDDLGEALTLGRGKIRMMGGGNPAHIPAMEAIWRERMRELLEEPSGELDRVLGDYDPPAGSPAFRSAVADFLGREYGWNLTSANIAVTNGGQSAFFFLLNRFAGAMADGGEKRILLPLVPE